MDLNRLTASRRSVLLGAGALSIAGADRLPAPGVGRGGSGVHAGLGNVRRASSRYTVAVDGRATAMRSSVCHAEEERRVGVSEAGNVDMRAPWSSAQCELAFADVPEMIVLK